MTSNSLPATALASMHIVNGSVSDINGNSYPVAVFSQMGAPSSSSGNPSPSVVTTTGASSASTDNAEVSHEQRGHSSSSATDIPALSQEQLSSEASQNVADDVVDIEMTDLSTMTEIPTRL